MKAFTRLKKKNESDTRWQQKVLAWGGYKQHFSDPLIMGAVFDTRWASLHNLWFLDSYEMSRLIVLLTMFIKIIHSQYTSLRGISVKRKKFVSLFFASKKKKKSVHWKM